MPVEIADWNDLDNVRNDLTGDYVLVNDLDSETAGYAGIGDDFEPIGFIEGDSFTSEFGGSFDGDGFQISDLVIEYDNGGDIALFASTDTGALIENVSVDGSVMVANADDFCYAGLVGFHTGGTIQNCVSHVDVTVPDGGRVGGLVGQNLEPVTDSYATGSVEGDNGVGGLLGMNSDTVTESYATGSVEGNERVGGLAGRNTDTITDSYWDTETTGQSGSAGGTGLTTAEMQGSEAETNMSGFDFANVWTSVVESDDDTTADGYPILLAVDREQQLDAQGILSLPAFTIRALVNSESVEIQDIFTQIDGEVKEVSEVFAQVDGESRQV